MATGSPRPCPMWTTRLELEGRGDAAGPRERQLPHAQARVGTRSWILKYIQSRRGETMQNLTRIGHSLVELVIIIVLLVTITIGAVEFVYEFFLLLMITQASSARARAVSVL